MLTRVCQKELNSTISKEALMEPFVGYMFLEKGIAFTSLHIARAKFESFITLTNQLKLFTGIQ